MQNNNEETKEIETPTKAKILKTKTIKYGKIEIPINDGKSQYTPLTASKFIDHGDIMKTLAIAVRDGLPVLMIGESGTGKTSAIRALANKTQNGLRRVNLNGGTTADELVGRNMLNNNGTYWIDGILTEAMRNGEWIVLDEINAALPEVLFVLQSILDDDGYLVLTEKDDKEIVYKHKDFRLFATCNPPEYAGTKEMNKALLSRFAVCISAEFPNEKTELEIIENHLGNTVSQSEVAKKLVGLANETRNAKELGTADYAINTRDVLNTLKLTPHMNPVDALNLAFSNKLDITDKNALKALARLHLPINKNAGTKKQHKLSKINELKIGGEYILTKDSHEIYFALTSDEKAYKEKIQGGISDIIGTSRTNAIKGDQFKIEAFFWENIDESTKEELTNAGEKITSAIKITTGPNKGKFGFVTHHDALGTKNFIKDIAEIK